MPSLNEEIRTLERKIQQLNLSYDHYFGGREPREPLALRSEVQRQLAYFSGSRITNTALRFRVGTLRARFQTLSQQWDRRLRELEEGIDDRQRFRKRQQGRAPASGNRKI